MGKELLYHMLIAKVQARVCTHAVSPEPKLYEHVSGRSRGNSRQRTRRVLADGQGMHTERLI